MRSGARALLRAVVVTGVLAGAAGPSTDVTQAGLRVAWDVLGPEGGSGGAFRSELTLINGGPRVLGSSGWTLYFNSSRRLLPESLPPSVHVTHLNGDFHKLEPTAAFEPLAPGQSRRIPLATREPIINISGVPSGFYLVSVDASGVASAPESVPTVAVHPPQTPEQTRRGGADQVPVPTPALRFSADAGLRSLAPGQYGRIVPTPVATRPARGSAILSSATDIHAAPGLEGEAAVLKGALGAVLRQPSGPAGAAVPSVLRLETGPLVVGGRVLRPGDEGYRLSVGPRGITIRGIDAAGVFYGIQTLRALVPPEAYRAPTTAVRLDAVEIEDAPRFSYRGLMLDVARSFHPRAGVMKLVELMAFYKLNTLHLHLSDDEGWRLEIPSLPELTEVGGRRGHTLDERDRLVPSFGSGPDPERLPGSGYYTRAEFIELLRHAAALHIEVIPELDMPGHARAAVVAMRARAERLTAAGRPQEAAAYRLHEPEDRSSYRSVQGWNDNVLNVCQPSAYAFVATVVDQVAEMYRAAGVRLRTFHIGGDEVPAGAWERSPACATLAAAEGLAPRASELHDYFVRKVNHMLSERGVITGGWEEIALTRTAVGGRVVALPNPALRGQVRPNVWNNIWGEGGEDHAYRLANAGYDVVMSHAANLYFDLAYEKDPEEPGQSWAGFVDTRSAYEFAPFDLFRTARTDLMGAPIDRRVAFKDHVRLREDSRRHILGLQGHLWSEYAREQATVEYLVFPKLLGLAERAWAPPPAWERTRDDARREALLQADWNEFANRLGRVELPRLCFLAGGVQYRLPLPGAVIEDGWLKASVAFPGLTIRYTTDGSEPTRDSPAYVRPVPVRGTVRLKTFADSGRGSRTSVVSAPTAQAARVR
jgi:hexosaminidase